MKWKKLGEDTDIHYETEATEAKFQLWYDGDSWLLQTHDDYHGWEEISGITSVPAGKRLAREIAKARGEKLS